MRRVGRYDQVGHLALSASELLSGGGLTPGLCDVGVCASALASHFHN